jgi:hypothetical protein
MTVSSFGVSARANSRAGRPWQAWQSPTQHQGCPTIEGDAALETQATAAVRREHAGGLVIQKAGKDDDAAPRKVAFKTRRQTAQGPGQDVGDDQVVGRPAT